MLTATKKKGLGGGIEYVFKCRGCWIEGVSYKTSELTQESRRQLVSLALSLAFFISGHGYAGKTMGNGLGLGITSEKPFLEVLILPYLTSRPFYLRCVMMLSIK